MKTKLNKRNKNVTCKSASHENKMADNVGKADFKLTEWTVNLSQMECINKGKKLLEKRLKYTTSQNFGIED